MRFPWISRSSHEEVVKLIAAQAAELKEERRILLDRLASIGLGGPLYETTVAESVPEAEFANEEPADPENDTLERLMRLRHRPAKLADALTRRAYKDYGKRSAASKVAWIPQPDDRDKINSALDQAEDLGKRSSVSFSA